MLQFVKTASLRPFARVPDAARRHCRPSPGQPRLQSPSSAEVPAACEDAMEKWHAFEEHPEAEALDVYFL